MDAARSLSIRIRRCAPLLVVLALVLSTTALTAEPISEQEAHAIGVDTYLYFYSPVTMDLTRKQLTNVEPGKGFGGPTNTFANVPAYPTAEDRGGSTQLRHALFLGVARPDEGADGRISAG